MNDADYERHITDLKVQELMDRCNAPRRHRKLVDRTSTPAWNETLQQVKDSLGTGFIIGLVGGRGNGKTQIAVDIMMLNVSMKKPSLYITAMEFFSRLKDTYRRDSEISELGMLSEMRSYKLLVIDEIGRRGETDWENNQLFELINSRYNDLRDTLLISNQTKEEFEKSIGPSLSSRMNETGGLIEATWESFRK